MSKYIEEKLKEFDRELVEMNLFKGRDMYNRPPLYDTPDEKIEEIKQFIKQALQEQEDRIREEEYQRRRGATSKAANVNYFSGYEKGRRCAMKNRIDDVIQSQDIAFDAGYARAKQEMKEKLMQIVVEDVPHQYQERLLKELNI